MAVTISLQMSHDLGICKNHGCNKQFLNLMQRGKLHLVKTSLSSLALPRDPWSIRHRESLYRQKCSSPCKHSMFRCHSFLNPGNGNGNGISSMKNVAVEFTRSCITFQDSPIVLKLVSAVGIIAFAVWGLGPLIRQGRHKNDCSSKKSDTGTYHVTTSYLLPLLLWTGVTLICRELDPVVLPSEGSQIVKQRILNFIRSLSTVLALAYYLLSAIQQAQKFFMGTNNSTDPRPVSSTGFTMGFQFISKAVYPAVLVAAVALFLELLGISTQKLLTAGGLGTVLLTFAGREIFRNFLSSAIIHATRPFAVNDWIQTKIEGYYVSGHVERVGWWTPTIIRGENREAVHIPNHQFTINVVSNLSQKTHWRIKTHLEISYLDFDKISNIVADMRKLLAKNPNLEHKKLHRRVFLVEINPKNPGLVILVSCFVKTSHVEEYKNVREAILLELIRIINHHKARLATPIRTVQYSNSDFDEIPFSDSPFNHVGVASNRPLLLTESSYKINGDDRTKTQTRSTRAGGEQDGTATAQPPLNGKTNAKVPPHSKAKETPISEPNVKHRPTPDSKVGVKAGEIQNLDTKEENTDRKVGEKVKAKSKLDSDVPSIQQLKQQTERPPQPPASRPPLEENIVLGVALGGSKRTLPIEEGMAPAPVQSEVKEMAKSRTGNGFLAAEKDKKDSQLPNVPSTTSSGDQGKPQN
ncbi:hypothetical protein RHGRI_030100 [Rhododendron griersonianum]|uniref:Uncharacterized protein n=1 Tax=Rhododendron griersonianum TaxID=479676 RepID=A0AAV6ILS2_9ERIC|nr:hypothetical protein RHGRI_030100 [Rhododendron griersonianum]